MLLYHKQIHHKVIVLISGLIIVLAGDVSSQVHDTLKWKLQKKQPVLNVIKTNPLPVFLGSIPGTSEYRISMEYVTGPQQSSQIGLSYLGKWWLFKTDTNFLLEVLKVNGFRFQGTFKFYLNKQMPFLTNLINDYDNAPYGPYVAPHISFATAKLTTAYLGSTDIYLRFTQFNVSGIAGYQFMLFNAIAVDLFTGIGYKYNELIEHEPNVIRVINLREFLKDSGFFGWYYSGHVKIYLGFNIGVIF